MSNTVETTQSSSPAPAANPSSAEKDHHGGMIRAAGIVGFLTIVSRILGLVRFRLMGQYFGATAVADAFNFAFIFPNLTRRLFGEGALSSAFVPVFSEKLAKGDKASANRTGSVLLCRLGFWLTFSCIAVMVAVHIARYFISGNKELQAHFGLDLSLLEWMLPYLIFINLAAILMGILNSMDHFVMPAVGPILTNVLLIAVCNRYVLPYFGTTADERIWGLAYAVLAGGVLHLLIQVPPALMRGFHFMPSMDKNDEGYREVMNNFKPVVLLVAVFQINVMMDNIIAKVFISDTGPVTYLNMGTSIYQLPWSIVALALGTAALPMLSKFWAEKNRDEFIKTLLNATRIVLWFVVPCTVGVMLLSDDIVRLLYGAGKFLANDAEPVRRTAGVAFYSTLGLVFFSVNVILTRALYAMKDMKSPTTTSAWSVLINLILNFVLVLGTRWHFSSGYDAESGLKESGIALASTISNGWQTLMLIRIVRKQLADSGKISMKFLTAMGGTALVSVPVAVYAYYYFNSKPDTESFYGFFACIAASIGPFYFVGRQYFLDELGRLHPAAGKTEEFVEQARYGIPDKYWTEQLKFEYSIYSTILCSAIMGFLVWAVRDSLPPEGHNFWMAFQRAVVPVAAGIAGYMVASSGFLSREYEEIWAAFHVKYERLLKRLGLGSA